MKKFIYKNCSLLFASLFVLSLGACKKDYLVTSPTEQVPGDVVFQTTGGAFVALDGTYRSMYRSLTDHGNFGQKAADIVLDLMGTDMVVHTQGYNQIVGEYQYGNALTLTTATSRSDRTWFYYYRTINNLNLILSQIDAAVGPEADKNYIKGQALALRAHSYFYLINFFQQNYKGHENSPGVPLYTEPTSEGKGRGTVQQVYDQIIADLKAAEPLLAGAARKATSYLTDKAVFGIHARVALQMDDYATAREYAKKARAGYAPMTTALYTTTGFNTISSPEWLWGLEVNTEQATIYASFYSHMDAASGGYATLGTQKKITKALYDQIPATDIRKSVFTADANKNATFPVLNQLKFRLRTPGNWASDYVLMRASEMYLIEAEASARLGDEGNAITVLQDLISVRNPNYSAAGLSGSALLNEILLQRRIELWGEGFGLLDIKRLKIGLNRPSGDGNHGGWNLMNPDNKASNLAPGILTLPDNSPRFLLRIPDAEINANKELTVADQNP